MKNLFSPGAILLLEDGSVFYGKAVGKIGTSTGEICYNTGMTGYQEVFTDPSYFGQILVTTASHIGNYGISSEDVESESVKIAGLVCKKFSANYSRKRADQSIQQYFEKEGVVGISDVDTRALVRRIRDKGAMNAIISSEIEDIEDLKLRLKKVPSMDGLELASKVSTKETYTIGDEQSELKVAILDLGLKRNIANCLVQRGCFVKVFPHNTCAEEILEWSPNGVLLSNGPGDPLPLTEVIKNIGALVSSDLPVFGICLGHQLLALSQGLETLKMHNGHRGVNHPVKNLATGKCEVTSHNHGFVVSTKSAEEHKDIEITHVHLNDDTLSGIRLLGRNVFSVQYHPEASPGPHDSRYLFDNFVNMMVAEKAKVLN